MSKRLPQTALAELRAGSLLGSGGWRVNGDVSHALGVLRGRPHVERGGKSKKSSSQKRPVATSLQPHT